MNIDTYIYLSFCLQNYYFFLNYTYFAVAFFLNLTISLSQVKKNGDWAEISSSWDIVFSVALENKKSRSRKIIL